ncbi:MAG: arginine--tRNA ligase [Candidatus Omnitrophica bacterium]|nr:arginine--tRNA ligase [Candidatus Omnitrophota bacterium]MDD5592346.1 arginine--tRNA ligase [Candidatus Omnitrophota bacterium]
MKKDIKDFLIPLIKNSLKDLLAGRPYEEPFYLDFPQDIRFGDLSTNIALRLSKLTGKSPLEVATALVANIKRHLEKSPVRDDIREIKIEGAGFINFYLSANYFYQQLRNLILKDKNSVRANLGKGRRVLIEFVSANPTGPLSVAHARQAAVGDALANILDFLGFRVKREYYLNDEGNQINILGESIELRLKELSAEQIVFPEDHYQGEYIYDIAKEVQSAKRKVQNLSEYGVKYILGIIKKELADFGVKFDYWYSQKKLRESGKIKKALGFLKKKNFIYEQDGALWFKSTLFKDDKDRVVVKSDTSYTYLAPDIAYHQDKFKRGFSWLINLWGPDHHGYINRLKAAVEALGKDPASLSVIIVQLASIFREGKPVQMSTRRGQYITLREVLDEVGLDASRFFFLMRRTSSHLDFDLAVAKKQTQENPVYYVQYAHARICSILEGSFLKIKPGNLDLTLLKEVEEMGLIKKLWQFSSILNICYTTLDPYMLTVYLQELSEDFHKFYDKHRVLGQDEKLTKARIALIQATRIILALGLELLGVSRPAKM